MKTMQMGKGVEIRTPWLGINEAAAYCSMSREKFLRVSEKFDVSHGGGVGNDRCYHVQALDRLLRQSGYYPPETMIVTEETELC
jgi:hypothetical protein